jgi:predicted DNA-binding transcriptional regulator AlpA
MRNAPPIRLLDKAEVLRITGVSFPTLWSWMRAGKFPRARVSAGGGSKSKSVWRSDEVELWINNLAVRPLKDDPPPAKSQLNVKA